MESVTINTGPFKSSVLDKKGVKKANSSQAQDRPRHTLKEVEENKYLFPNSYAVAMLENLIKKKVIELPKCKRLEEMNCTDNSRYCKYHRVISHLVKKCFEMKYLIMKLA